MRERVMGRRVAGLAVVLGLVLAPTAYGQVPPQDSVVGSAIVDESINAPEGIWIDAHSGPSGENPTGTVSLNRCVGSSGAFCGPSGVKSGRVTCLNVQGNHAVVGFYGYPTIYGGGDGPFTVVGLAEVVDNGVGPAKHYLAYGATFADSDSAVPYTQCPSTLPYFGRQVPASPDSGFSQDFTVTDAHPLPTSKDECKKGGWQTFGVFKNQGDCVSFVATGRKNPPAG